jgi:hypothetical protein
MAFIVTIKTYNDKTGFPWLSTDLPDEGILQEIVQGDWLEAQTHEINMWQVPKDVVLALFEFYKFEGVFSPRIRPIVAEEFFRKELMQYADYFGMDRAVKTLSEIDALFTLLPPRVRHSSITSNSIEICFKRCFPKPGQYQYLVDNQNNGQAWSQCIDLSYLENPLQTVSVRGLSERLQTMNASWLTWNNDDLLKTLKKAYEVACEEASLSIIWAHIDNLCHDIHCVPYVAQACFRAPRKHRGYFQRWSVRVTFPDLCKIESTELQSDLMRVIQAWHIKFYNECQT